MKDIIKVGIIEDDPELAGFLKNFIQAAPGFECHHSFSSAEDAIRKIPTLGLHVVLTDIGLPGMSGIGCIAFLKPLYPDINFLVCTSYEDSDSVFEALKAGATGYLTKGDPPEIILEAIRQVNDGGSPMSNNIARLVVNYFQQQQHQLSEMENLSSREQEILQLLSQGYRYKEIAGALFISTETVRTHIRNTYQKLQVTSRMEAINKVYGVRRGS